MGNYPPGFNGLDGTEDKLYYFEMHEEILVDAETENQAMEILKTYRMADLDEMIDDIPPIGFDRYIFEIYGKIIIEASSEEYAEEEFRNLTIGDALEKGLRII